MGDPRALANKATADKCIDARGISSVASRLSGEMPKTTAREFASQYPGVLTGQKEAPPQHVDEYEFGVLPDLVAAQGSEPISPRRAQAIRDRYGLESRTVTDPEAAAKMLMGFEIILIAASFVPPLALPADVTLVLLGFLKGKPEEGVINAAAIPFNLLRSAKAVKLLEAILKPAVRGTRIVARTLEHYKDAARFLLRYGGTSAPMIAKTIRTVKADSRWGKAAAKAAEVFKAQEKVKDFKAAASAAGTEFDRLIGAAGAGKGVDFKGRRLIADVKTHWAPIMDEFTFAKGNEQVLSYLLKDLVEEGVTRGGRVIHVFIKRNGEAVMVTVDALDGRKLIEVVNAVIPK